MPFLPPADDLPNHSRLLSPCRPHVLSRVRTPVGTAVRRDPNPLSDTPGWVSAPVKGSPFPGFLTTLHTSRAPSAIRPDERARPLRAIGRENVS
ncbi:hypothetical protein GCM10020256_64300 [Streptomyces thermocoprophilus]